MFKNKRRAGSTSSSTRAPSAPVSSAASTAAAQAFLANRASSAILSSAAAAAALRSHTVSPTSVADVQTKRTIKRQPSQSSNGSGPKRPGSLTRHGSSGSMTERSFRDPSPGRPSSQTRADDAPPMPVLPKTTSPSPKPGSAKKKKAVVGTGDSPSPAQDKVQRSSLEHLERSSLDRSSQQSPDFGIRRASVNFSRPMSPTASPPITPIQASKSPRKAQDLSLSRSEQEAVEFAIADAATAPVKRKKAKTAPQITEGSHLATGSTGAGKPTGTAVGKDELGKAPAVTQPSSEPVKKKKQTTSQSPEPRTSLGESEAERPVEKSRSLRASGALVKQPSIVREDREGEEREESLGTAATAPNGHARSQTASDANLKLAPLDTVNLGKRNSSSPGRSAHFSSQPALHPGNGRLHEPPGRSISPAKSAMKRTPSPRVPSPSETQAQSWNRPGFTPSEASDVPSYASEDTKSRKKKGVHVSFDDEPIVVGESARPQSTTSTPILASPQNEKQARRSWFSFGRDKSKPSAIDEEDDFMKPRPALPSFGSVRGKREMDTRIEDKSEPAIDFHAISSDHAVGAILAQDASKEQERLSNDPLPPEVTSVEGSGYHSDSEESSVAVELPEESTPQREITQEAVPEPTAVRDTPDDDNLESKEAEKPGTQTHSMEVPQISVQPSTPGVETEAKRDSFLYVPGGFPSSDSLRRSDSLSSANGSVKTARGQTSSPETTIQSVQSNEADSQAKSPLTEEALATATKPAQEPARYSEGDESDGSEASVYSDAASEASNFEGDRFGSINAIMESPIHEPKAESRQRKSSLDERPPTPPPTASSRILAGQLQSANSIVNEQPKATSSGNESKRETPAEEAAPKEPEGELVPKESTPNKEPASPLPNRTSSPSEPTTLKATKPSATTSMRKSMREASSAQGTLPPSEPIASKPNKSVGTTSMRKSMREASPAQSTSPHQFRASMRGPGGSRPRSVQSESRQPKAPLKTRSDVVDALIAPKPESRGTLTKKIRPSSVVSADATPPRLTKGKPRSRPASMSGIDLKPSSSAIPPVPKLKTGLGNDSDSDSSFKRARHNRSSSGSHVTMRRSMRANPPASSAEPLSQAFSARTTSLAAGSRMSGNASMRTTMRSQPATDRQQSPSRRLFGKKKAKADPAPLKPASRFKSRFVDSDDEDDGGPRMFTSRFVDSSDEDDDEPAPLDLTPVRGIPRRADDAESTDLDGEEENEGVKTPKQAPSPVTNPRPLSLAIPNGNTSLTSGGNALASKTLRPNGTSDAPGRAVLSLPSSPTTKRPLTEKRRSFFGSLGRRKDKTSKIGKIDIESAARRDTPLERSKFERTLTSPAEHDEPNIDTVDKAAFEEKEKPPASPSIASSPRSPKLQRRVPSRTTSDAWPLPPPIPEDPIGRRRTMSRPATSDGTVAAARPALGPRGLSGTVVQMDGREVVLGRTGKKKRFTALRKAFGLKD